MFNNMCKEDVVPKPTPAVGIGNWFGLMNLRSKFQVHKHKRILQINGEHLTPTIYEQALAYTVNAAINILNFVGNRFALHLSINQSKSKTGDYGERTKIIIFRKLYLKFQNDCNCFKMYRTNAHHKMNASC